MAVHEIELDVRKRTGRVPPEVVVRQSEEATQTVRARLLEDGEPYAPGLPSARLDVLHASGTWARVEAEVAGEYVTCTLPSAAAASPGVCRLAYFAIYGDSALITTEGFCLRVLPCVDVSASDAGKDYDDQMERLKDEWEAYIKSAEAGGGGGGAAYTGEDGEIEISGDAVIGVVQITDVSAYLD